MIRRFVCFAAAVALQVAVVSNAQAGVLSASEDFRASSGGPGVLIVDSSSGTTSLALSDPLSSISNVVVSVNISKSGSGIDSNGNLTGGGFTFNREVVLRLTSAAGTTVNLVNEDTFSGQNDPGVNQQTLTFDDSAGSAVGGSTIVTGTFQPVGSLASLIGEDPTGNWTLFYQDTVGSDPLSVNDWSLTVTTGAVPEPASLAIFGLGALGLAVGGIRRRKRTA